MTIANVVFAQEYNGITLTMRDGTASVITFKGENPTITYSNNKLIISTTESTTEFDRNNVARLIYNEGANVANIINDNISFNQKEDALIITGLPTNSNISIYSIDGRLINCENSIEDYYILYFNSLNNGIYIVSVNGVSTKISISR